MLNEARLTSDVLREPRDELTTHAFTQAPDCWDPRFYRRRRPLVLLAYGAIAVAAYLGGFLLRFEFGGFNDARPITLNGH
jgi:hypothetical protein